jgi:hypothetical protein
VLSPDGKYVAYKSLPAFVKDELQKNHRRNGYPPSNFWVMEVASGQAFKVADQPADAKYADPNKPGSQDKYTTRYLPAWSPDSRTLAWGEIIGAKHAPEGNWGGYIEQLLVYDLAQKRAKVVTQNLPAYEGINEANYIAWGKPGLAMAIPVGAGNGENTLYIYSAAGKLLHQYVLDPSDYLEWLANPWINDHRKDYILTHGDSASPSALIDPETGKKQAPGGMLELYSTMAPDGIHAYYDKGWNIEEPGKTPLNIGELIELAISPDGMQVVYSTDNGDVMLYRDGGLVTFPLKGGAEIGGFVWGPVAFRVRQ